MLLMNENVWQSNHEKFAGEVVCSSGISLQSLSQRQRSSESSSSVNQPVVSKVSVCVSVCLSYVCVLLKCSFHGDPSMWFSLLGFPKAALSATEKGGRC